MSKRKFTVTVTNTWYSDTTFQVEADSPERAKDIAHELVHEHLEYPGDSFTLTEDFEVKVIDQ